MAYERDRDRYTRGAGAIAAFDRNPRRAAVARAQSMDMLRRDEILSGITYGTNGGLAGLGRTAEDRPQTPHNQGGGGGSGTGGGRPKPSPKRPPFRGKTLADQFAMARLRVLESISPVKVPTRRVDQAPPPPPPPPSPPTSTTTAVTTKPKPSVVVSGGGGTWTPPPLPAPVDLPPPLTTVIDDPAVTPAPAATDSRRGIFILAAIIGGAWLLLREEES